MAAPHVHGLITVSLLFIINKFQALSFLEIFSALFWGILTDIDHFMSISYIKDIPRRIKEGGDPAGTVIIPICWLHRWPGCIVVLGWTAVFLSLDPSFNIYVPAVFWLGHLAIDRSQRDLEFFSTP